jgi:tetratricopeptide (TPR) repeat protein
MARWGRGAPAVPALLILVGCTRASSDCEKKVAAADFTAAAAACAEAMAQGNDRAAIPRAKALLQLRRNEELIALSERTRAKPWASPVLLAAGKAHHQTRRFEPARDAFADALALARADKNAADEARAAFWLHRLHHERNEYGASLTYAREAYAAALRTGDDEMVGTTLMGIFQGLFEIGDDESALRVLQMAKALRDRDREDRAHLLILEGALYRRSGRSGLAGDRYRSGLEIGRELKLASVCRAALQNLFELALEEHELDAAESYLGEAEQLLEVGGPPDPDRRVSLLYRRARLERARRNLDRAASFIERARGASPSPDWLWQLDVEDGAVAEMRRDRAAAERHYEHAVAVLENMRAELKADDFKTAMLAAYHEPYERLFVLRAKAGRSREALAAAEQGLARSFLDAFVGAQAPAASPASLSEDELLLRADSIRALLPSLRASPTVRPRPIAQVLDRVRRDYVLAWVEADKAMWLIRVARGQPRIHRLPIGPGELRALIDRWRSIPDDAAAAEAVGAALFLPGALPRRGESVFLVAGGVVSRAPVSAIRRNGRRLVQDHVFRTIPSLSLLAAIRESDRSSDGQRIAFADPKGDLPGARAEAAIAAAAGVEVFAGREATRARLQSAARASLLHLATHSGMGAHGGWLTLADGQVGASDVLTLGLRPTLVLISGCASSASSLPELWGSLAGSFLAAGSRTVIASLWTVGDSAAAALMSQFYGYSTAGSDPATALAKAQRDMLAAGNAPSTWAPFVAVGD